jgi:hypothetical protein
MTSRCFGVIPPKAMCGWSFFVIIQPVRTKDEKTHPHKRVGCETGRFCAALRTGRCRVKQK